jgi:sortase A
MSSPPPSSPRRLAAGVLAVVLGLAACGGPDSAEPPTTAASIPNATQVVTAPTTAAPITAPPTTPATEATTAYTLPPEVVLPEPQPPPVDDEASEPVVALGSIAIPAIGIDRPLYEGIRLPTFDLGPGHWPGTALPGQVGNMVIGGHRTSGHADFGELDRLQPGDDVTVTDTAGASFTYRVDSIEITDPFAARVVYQTPARTATLFACHPPGSTTQRIVVHLTFAA